MLSRFRRLPSPALVISVLALVVAVGGGTFAFAAINNKKVKKISTSTANKLITKRAPTLSVSHAQTADTATTATTATNAGNAAKATNATTAANAENLGSQPPSAYARSTVVRSVTIAGDGTIDPSRSDGITQANVTHPGTGEYCINGLDPAPKTATAQFEFDGDYGAQLFLKTNPSSSQICAGLQVGIATYSSGNTLVNEPIEVIVH